MKKLLLFFVLNFMTLAVLAQVTTNPPPTPTNLGIAGDATPGWWNGPDLELSFNENSQLWTGNVSLTNGEIKFRFDNSWDVNFGGEWGNAIYNGILVPGGANIPVVTGDYYVKVDLNAMTYAIESQLVEIPDQNFEQALIDLDIDLNGLTGDILRSDAENATEVIANFPLLPDGAPNPFADPRVTITEKIKELTGIEAFINLNKFGAGYQDLTSVDLSHNTLLFEAFLNDNRLSSIDVSKNMLLTRFGVMRNPNIAGLDVSNNLLLEELFVDGTAMTSIDVSTNINLWKFYGRWGNLTGIDLSSNINLRDIRLRGSGNLTYLNIRNGNNINVTAFDVRDMANLSCITTDDLQSQLMIDFSNGKTFSPDCGTVYIPDSNFENYLETHNSNGDLVALGDAASMGDGVLNNLTLNSKVETVVSLNVNDSNIASLQGIEAFINLQTLFCQRNQLESLDVSNNLALSVLECESNLFTSLDVSKNTALTVLGCADNNLSSLDVSNNLFLEAIWCTDNNIQSLNLELNKALSVYGLFNNPLTSLSIKNENNVNMVYIDAHNLPNLTCMTVDDESASYLASWNVDPDVTFSNDCGYFVNIPDPNFEQALIDLEIDSDGVMNGSLLRSDAENATEVNVTFPIFNGAPNPAADPRVTITTEITDLTGIEAFANLSVLYCQYNQLQGLDVSDNTALTILECEGNQLTELDVKNNLALRVLGFGPNNISGIDVSQNLLLEAIWTNGNNLSTLNLDANSVLAVIGLSNNPYSYVSLKNGNNLNVQYIEAMNLPTLGCIEVDDINAASYLKTNFNFVDEGLTFSEDCSTSIAGRWIIAPEAGALKVGPEPGSDLYWALNKFGDDIAARSCYMDDIYEFGTDGSFKNILGIETWLEPFQGVTTEQCGVPVAPHDGSSNATYVYDQFAGSISLNGQGAYLGLPKANNDGNLTDLTNVPESITYDVSFSENGNVMTLIIETGAGLFWTFKLIKESVFIPDTNFEQALVDLNIDSDGTINKRILRSDAEAQTGQLDVSNKNISDLTGIEAFTNLTRLKAWDNQLTRVDVTQNINLTRLEIVNNQLSNIDVTNNTELTILWLENNLIETIDVSNNTKLLNLAVGINPLIALDVTQNINLWALTTEVTQISEIDLTQNTALEQLWIADNPNLTKLDLSKNSLLFNLGIYNTSISVLDLSNNNITRLYAYDNASLEHLDMRNDNNSNVTLLYIGNTPNLSCINVDATISQAMIDERDYQAKTFSEDCGDFVYIPDANFEQALIAFGIDSDGVLNQSILRNDAESVTGRLGVCCREISDLTGLEAFVNITELQAGENLLTEIDVSKNIELLKIWVYNNQLTSLDLSYNTKMQRVSAGGNQLASINLTGLNDVHTVLVWQNQLSDLDISDLSQLITLDARQNQLTGLVTAGNVSLQGLILSDNNIEGLDLSSNGDLQNLQVGQNNLTSLDISANQVLTNLNASYNAGLKLTTVAITGSPSLLSLDLSNTELSNFNPTLYPNLEWLLLDENNLTRLNTGNIPKIQLLSAHHNMITDLDVSSNTQLTGLYIYNNQLESLNVQNGNNVNLLSFDATNNLLTCIMADADDDTISPYNTWQKDIGVILSLDCGSEPEVVLIPDSNFESALAPHDTNGLNGNILLSDALAVIDLDVSGKNILNLTGIEAFENLLTLNVTNNSLSVIEFTSVDYNGPTDLVNLDVSGNLLTELVVVSGRSLERLIADNNQLISINFADITTITELNLSNNDFTKLDLSANDLLQQLDVSTNPLLEELNLLSGNNSALTNIDASDNPSLYCIGVDDPVQADANTLWIIDSHTTYNDSGDCLAPNVITLDIEVSLDRNGLASIAPADIDGGSTDNVSSSNRLVLSTDISDFDCSNLGLNVVELSVTDEAGNTGIGYANVTIIDIEFPDAKAVRTFSYDLNGADLTLDPSTIDDGSSDNCDIASIALSQSYFTLPGTFFVELIVEDTSGNMSTDQVEIEITDSVGSTELRFGGTTVIVYPNPFNDEISLNFSRVTDFSNVSANLTDFVGNPISTTFVAQDTLNLNATGLSYLPPGEYILSLTVGNRTRTAILIHE